jgi:hypothetical protein
VTNVQLLLARLGGEDRHLDPVPATLVVRSSTGPAKGKGRAGARTCRQQSNPDAPPTCSREAAETTEYVSPTLHFARRLGEPLPIAQSDIDPLCTHYQNVYGQRSDVVR